MNNGIVDVATARALAIAEYGGLSDVDCIWKGCTNKALFEMAICFDHDNPNFDKRVADQRPEWYLVRETEDFEHAPEKLGGAEDAMQLLGRAAKYWRSRYLTSDGPPQDALSESDRWDRQLSRFAEQNPAALESLLLDLSWQKRLAYSCVDGGADQLRKGPRLTGLPQSILSNFLNAASPKQGEFLWRTMRTLQPRDLWQFVADCRTRYSHVLMFGLQLGNRLLIDSARWLGPDLFASVASEFRDVAPPGSLDVLRLCAVEGDRADDPPSDRTLPSILPESDAQLVELGATEITSRLARYRGMSTDDFSTMLVQQHFVAKGEKVGDVIVSDAQALLDLGISRHELAKAMSDACRLGRLQEQEEMRNLARASKHGSVIRGDSHGAFVCPHAGYTVRFRSTLGHHQDPFHNFDTYYLFEEVGGSADCAVRSQAGEIAFGDMQPYLIRRACFFEGAVRYRLDPAAACRVLGLV